MRAVGSELSMRLCHREGKWHSAAVFIRPSRVIALLLSPWLSFHLT